MVAWATLRAEWRGSADSYTLTVPAAWRAEGAELFLSGAPLAAAELRAFNNTKLQRRAMLRVGEELEGALQPDADFERELRLSLTDALHLAPAQAPTLSAASTPQVLGMLAAAFDGDNALPALREAVARWAAGRAQREEL
eukprot:gene15581-6818_t